MAFTSSGVLFAADDANDRELQARHFDEALHEMIVEDN